MCLSVKLTRGEVMMVSLDHPWIECIWEGISDLSPGLIHQCVQNLNTPWGEGVCDKNGRWRKWVSGDGPFSFII